MFPATASQAKMKEAMVEALAGHGDAQFVADGKVRQALSADLVMLGEEDLLLAAVQRPPAGDPAFEGAPHPVRDNGLPELVLHSLEDGDGKDALDLEQLFHARPHLFEGVLTGSPVALELLLLGWQAGIFVDPTCAAFADAGLGGRDGLAVLTTLNHIEKYLLIRNVVPRHRNPSLLCSIAVPIPPPAAARSEPPIRGALKIAVARQARSTVGASPLPASGPDGRAYRPS